MRKFITDPVSLPAEDALEDSCEDGAYAPPQNEDVDSPGVMTERPRRNLPPPMYAEDDSESEELIVASASDADEDDVDLEEQLDVSTSDVDGDGYDL